MLLDVQYVKPNRSKKESDCVYTIWKDLETKEKHVISTTEPVMPIYFEKPDRRNHRYPVDFREKEDLDKVVTKYSEIPFTIAKHMGQPGQDFLRNIFETRNYKDIRMLNTYPYVFGHDYDIRTYYRYEWRKNVGDAVIPDLNKGFLDIECDSFDIRGFANPANSPIDLVTVIDGKEKKTYTFALVGRPYPENKGLEKMAKIDHKAVEKALKYEEYRKKMYESRHAQEQDLMDHVEELKEELHEQFDESYGKFDFNFYFYKDEKKMLVHLFELIHTISPDFLMIWNISFDIPYILNRMKYLGLNPEEIICDKEFLYKNCYFVKDRRNFDIKNKSDHFVCSSKTVYVDQMELYGAIRKGREELRSFSLNYVARNEIGDEKLDYSEDGDIKTVAYRNYKKYFIYNIKDVLLQYGIEREAEDIETLYSGAYDNLTSYPDCFKQTVVLRNVQYRIYQDSMNLIPGANVNQILLQKDMELHPEKYTSKKKKEVDFEGALVGNTRLIRKFGKPLYGKRTNYMFKYSVDMDMTAFYPNTIWVLNICAATMIFKVTIDASQFTPRGGELPYHGITDIQLVKDNKDSFHGDIAGEIFDNFQTGNYLTLGHKFMNLPTITELERRIRNEVA